MAVFGDKLLRAVAAGDFGAFLRGLGDFLHGGGHLLPRVQADHCHIVGPAAQGDPRRVDGDIAAADDNGLALHLMAFVAAHGAQQVYGSLNACGILAGHARLAAALAPMAM